MNLRTQEVHICMNPFCILLIIILFWTGWKREEMESIKDECTAKGGQEVGGCKRCEVAFK